jgi:RNA methyltransferase, TrmH family
MLSQNKIKYVVSLHTKKNRQKYGIFVAEGEKIAEEILRNAKIQVEHIFATAKWIEKYDFLAKKFSNLLVEVTEQELKKISTLTTPNQVLITAKQPLLELDTAFINKDIVLYLDGIQDPGNMGTILRIADWFGIEYVFCSDTCVEVYNPKVIQATMGAFLRVKTKEIDLSEIWDGKVPIYGALLEGENIFSENLTKHGIIVIGNEGSGISLALQQLITHPIKIPPHGNGAESLNVAVATGIICALFRNK